AEWADRLQQASNQGLFTPPSLTQDTVYAPGDNGGSNIFGTATDPTTGTVYVVSKNVPELVKLRTKPEGGGASPAGATPAQFGRAVYERNCEMCHGTELKGGAGPSLEGVVQRRGQPET